MELYPPNLRGRQMKRVFICSPFDGDTDESMDMITSYIRYALMNEVVPIVPQIYTLFTDDGTIGVDMVTRAKRELLWVCDELWVFGNEITGKMQTEIDFCKNLNVAIRYVSEDEIRRLLK